MFYCVLCYHTESVIGALSKAEDDAMMAGLAHAQAKLEEQGKLGPSARLMPTSSAVTLRQRGEQVVLDGPFAETKEQLLGFYVVECDTLEEAIEAARPLSHEGGALEIRPIGSYFPQGAAK